jgi:hypothetical protein
MLIQQGCATTSPRLSGSPPPKGSAIIVIDKEGKVLEVESVIDDSGKTKKADKKKLCKGETLENTSAIIILQTKENPCYNYICGRWGCYKYEVPCPQ